MPESVRALGSWRTASFTARRSACSPPSTIWNDSKPIVSLLDHVPGRHLLGADLILGDPLSDVFRERTRFDGSRLWPAGINTHEAPSVSGVEPQHPACEVVPNEHDSAQPGCGIGV